MAEPSVTLPGTSLSSKVKAAIKAANPAVEAIIRDEALEAGWPENAANDISVSDYSITVGSAAADWEFGLPGKPPTPVVRTNKSADTATAALLDEVYSILKRQGTL